MTTSRGSATITLAVELSSAWRMRALLRCELSSVLRGTAPLLRQHGGASFGCIDTKLSRH
jgi:hypothetical protein